MNESWKAMLRATREFFRWCLRFITKPIIAFLTAISETAMGWAEQLGKI